MYVAASVTSALNTVMEEINVERVLVALMLGTSLLLVAVALERAFALARVALSVRAAERIILIGRQGTLHDARQACEQVRGPVPAVLAAGLDRALGRVRGEPAMAMLREQKRLAGRMKSRSWILGTAGALMPFVGLFGTVLGVMSSFEAIGETGQGGFAVVSVGISQALVATAVGIAVALEGVVLFNVLQNVTTRLSRDLSMQIDEMLELIVAARNEHHAVSARR